MKKRFITIGIFALSIVLLMNSCKKDDGSEVSPPDIKNYTYGNGVFIVNEGAFGQGSASMTFFNKEYNKLYNDVFLNANNRPLGDIAQSMEIFDGMGYIVVNNSGTVEVVNLNTFKSTATISNLASPRYTLILNGSKGYITHLTEAKISVFNPTTNIVTHEISTAKSCENILYADGKIFVTNWSNFFVPANNNTVLVIDTDTDLLIDSILVTKEPNSMVLDKDNKIWVLCSGGYMSEEIPALYRIEPSTLTIEKTFEFPEITSSPNKLCINGTGDTLYYLNAGAFKMSVDASSLPGNPFIFDQNIFFYSMGIDPATGMTHLGDAIDFNQNGLVYRYKKGGELYMQLSAGIVPGAFCFTP
ncbi:MAG: YncE family protein [Bacteroidota bacterium]|nr:YncE family protein [Bacteroidota bacterium]